METIKVSEIKQPKRRIDKEGTIKNRADGRREAQARVLMLSGKHERISVYAPKGTTDKALMDKLEERVKKKLTPPLEEPEAPLTLADYLHGWIGSTPDLKPKTVMARELNIRRIISVLRTSIALVDVTPAHVREVDDSLSSRGRSGATRKQCFAIFRAAMKQAVVDYRLTVSPFARVTWRPKAAKKEQRVVTMDERSALFLTKNNWTPMWKLFLATGLREGELLGLRWEHVDLDAGVLSVRETLQNAVYRKDSRGYITLPTPKTDNSRRDIELDSLVVALLVNIRATQQAENREHPEGYVFTDPFGKPIRQHIALYAFKRDMRLAGAGDAHIHNLRHTYGYDHLEAGSPILQISRNMGHSSVAFTMQVYGHVSTETTTKTAETSGRLLAQAERMAAWMQTLPVEAADA